MPNLDLPILVVDDAKFSSMVVGRTLRNARYRDVRIANNAPAALEFIDQRPVSVLIADWLMPEMDGLTATREIRANPDWRDLPIISLTAKATAQDQAQCIAAGANDYLAKPLDVDKLLSLVRVWMPR